MKWQTWFGSSQWSDRTWLSGASEVMELGLVEPVKWWNLTRSSQWSDGTWLSGASEVMELVSVKPMKWWNLTKLSQWDAAFWMFDLQGKWNGVGNETQAPEFPCQGVGVVHCRVVIDLPKVVQLLCVFSCQNSFSWQRQDFVCKIILCW